MLHGSLYNSLMSVCLSVNNLEIIIQKFQKSTILMKEVLTEESEEEEYYTADEEEPKAQTVSEQFQYHGSLRPHTLFPIPPTKNKVIRSLQVVLSYIIQIIAFGTVPHPSVYAGALMIVVAVLGVVLEDKVINMVNHRYF